MFESQLMSGSSELRAKWFGCHLIRDSSDLVVIWFEIQVIWLSSDLRFQWFWFSMDPEFNWFGCRMIWNSSGLVVKWFGIQMIWLSSDLRFKWFGCQMIWDLSDLVVIWFDMSKMKLWSSKTKLFCETSFKIEALKLKNEAFLRDFLQEWSFEAQNRSFSARLPSKMKLWRSKTKLFCETSFKNEALKLKNEAFLRDFLQKWSFEAQERSFSARLLSKMKLWRSKTNSKVLRLPRKSWAEAYEVL